MLSSLKRILVFSAIAAVIILIYRLLWFKTMLEPYRPEWFVLGFGCLLLVSGFVIARRWPAAFEPKEKVENISAGFEIGHFVAEHELSRAEAEVLKLLLEGKSNTEIAESRHVSLNTVKTHLSHIYSKTGTRHRTQLISALKGTLA
jgi:DNA-binding CsgD family transcriptional regulator